jgi:hypothetical protein
MVTKSRVQKGRVIVLINDRLYGLLDSVYQSKQIQANNAGNLVAGNLVAGNLVAGNLIVGTNPSNVRANIVRTKANCFLP